MLTHVLNTYNHTGERPQGCQAREHACRQLLKLVALKVQRAVATQKGEIDQIEPEQIVSARDRDSSRHVFCQVSQLLWHYNLTPQHVYVHHTTQFVRT